MMPSTKSFDELRKRLSTKRRDSIDANYKNRVDVMGVEILESEYDYYRAEFLRYTTIQPTKTMVDRYVLFRLIECTQEEAFLYCTHENEAKIQEALQQALARELEPQTLAELWEELALEQ